MGFYNSQVSLLEGLLRIIGRSASPLQIIRRELLFPVK